MPVSAGVGGPQAAFCLHATPGPGPTLALHGEAGLLWGSEVFQAELRDGENKDDRGKIKEQNRRAP